MKLLVAIHSENNANKIAKSVRWCSRTGFAFHVFVPKKQWEEYNDALKLAEIDYYLHFKKDVLLVDDHWKLYAPANNFDLVVEIKDDRPAFSKKTKRIKLDEEVYEFAKAVGEARLRMSKNKKLQSTKVGVGIRMYRVK